MACDDPFCGSAGLFAACVCSVAVLLGGCSRTVEEEPQLIEHRIEGCRQWCEWWTDPACPVDSPDGHRPDVEECFNGCATHDGKWSAGWGYVEAKNDDACVDEWTAHKDCALALTCDDKKIYFSLDAVTLGEDAPCHADLLAMYACDIENN